VVGSRVARCCIVAASWLPGVCAHPNPLPPALPAFPQTASEKKLQTAVSSSSRARLPVCQCQGRSLHLAIRPSFHPSLHDFPTTPVLPLPDCSVSFLLSFLFPLLRLSIDCRRSSLFAYITLPRLPQPSRQAPVEEWVIGDRRSVRSAAVASALVQVLLRSLRRVQQG
jgi:hypothetical protein